MNKLLILSLPILLTACGGGSSYKPSTGASGQTTFLEACSSCHNASPLFSLTKENFNAAYIEDKMATGNIIMPKFPNIQDQELTLLTQFVLENSEIKK